MVDISDWKEFVIYRIFEIESPAERSIKRYSEGDVPYVSSGAVNNGVVSYLEPKVDENLEKGNCITVSPLDGSSFYQKDDFLGRGGAGSAISKLYNENLTELNALFICAVIKASASRFNYDDALNSDNLKLLTIKLPAKKTNNTSYSDDGYEPDWKKMESYMKQIMDESEKNLKGIIEILNYRQT